MTGEFLIKTRKKLEKYKSLKLIALGETPLLQVIKLASEALLVYSKKSPP